MEGMRRHSKDIGRKKKRKKRKMDPEEEGRSPPKKVPKTQAEAEAEAELRKDVGTLASEMISFRAQMMIMRSTIEQVLTVDLTTPVEDIPGRPMVEIPEETPHVELVAIMEKGRNDLLRLKEEFSLMRVALTKILGVPLIPAKSRGEVIEITYEAGFEPKHNIRDVEFFEPPTEAEMVPPARFPGFDLKDINPKSRQGDKARVINKRNKVTAVVGKFPDAGSVLGVNYYGVAAQVQQNTLVLDRIRNHTMWQVKENRQLVTRLASSVEDADRRRAVSAGDSPELLLFPPLELPAPEEGIRPRPTMAVSNTNVPHLVDAGARGTPKRQGEVNPKKQGRIYNPRAEGMEKEEKEAEDVLVALLARRTESDQRGEQIDVLGGRFDRVMAADEQILNPNAAALDPYTAGVEFGGEGLMFGGEHEDLFGGMAGTGVLRGLGGLPGSGPLAPGNGE